VTLQLPAGALETGRAYEATVLCDTAAAGRLQILGP